MKWVRRDFLSFIAGVLSLGLFGWFVRRSMKTASSPVGDALSDTGSAKFVLPESAARVPTYRLDDLEFRVDRRRKVVCAFRVGTGEVVWESHGADRWIVPGAAFPMDLSISGELWVANVGRKRLEQLDPKTGRFIASWEPKRAFEGCCNPVRFAALTGGRFVTMEKGVRRACLYHPSGELESMLTDALSDSEFEYYLCRNGEKIDLYDTGIEKHWAVS